MWLIGDWLPQDSKNGTRSFHLPISFISLEAARYKLPLVFSSNLDDFIDCLAQQSSLRTRNKIHRNLLLSFSFFINIIEFKRTTYSDLNTSLLSKSAESQGISGLIIYPGCLVLPNIWDLFSHLKTEGLRRRWFRGWLLALNYSFHYGRRERGGAKRKHESKRIASGLGFLESLSSSTGFWVYPFFSLRLERQHHSFFPPRQETH